MTKASPVTVMLDAQDLETLRAYAYVNRVNGGRSGAFRRMLATAAPAALRPAALTTRPRQVALSMSDQDVQRVVNLAQGVGIPSVSMTIRSVIRQAGAKA